MATAPAPLGRAIDAYDWVLTVSGVLVRIQSDLRHHGRHDLVRVDHVLVGEGGVLWRKPVDPKLVVSPRAEDDECERECLHDGCVVEQVGDAGVLVGPEGLGRAREVCPAEIDRNGRACERADIIGPGRVAGGGGVLSARSSQA